MVVHIISNCTKCIFVTRCVVRERKLLKIIYSGNPYLIFFGQVPEVSQLVKFFFAF